LVRLDRLERMVWTIWNFRSKRNIWTLRLEWLDWMVGLEWTVRTQRMVRLGR